MVEARAKTRDMLPHLGHFEPRWAPPFPPCEELRRTCRAVVASTGNVVSRGVPKRRAHVARRRELALMLRIVVFVVAPSADNGLRTTRERDTHVFRCSFFVRLVPQTRRSVAYAVWSSELTWSRAYVAAVSLSCVNQDTLYGVQSKGNRGHAVLLSVLPIARLKVRNGRR